MSRIDELISSYCPDGVTFRQLAEIANTVPGLTGKTKSDFSDGNARFASYRNIFAHPSLDLRAQDFVKVNPGERQNTVQLGDILITGSSESLAEVGMSSVVTAEPSEPVYLNSFCFIVRLNQRDILVPDFAKHLFRSELVREQIRRTASGVTRINISKPRFMKISIPVPPLEVQREIVRILDQFIQFETELELELEAELEARRRQYEYYRDDLLAVVTTPDRRARLDELFDMRAGKFIAAPEISSEASAERPVPCYGGGGLRGYVAAQNQDGDLILIGRQGALCGNVKRVNGPFYATEHAVVVTPRHGVNVRWAFHLLTQMNLNQYASKSAQPGLAVGTLSRLVVEVPSHDEQVRVGMILDRFDALVNDISIDLAAELAARRKQYEYYRDKLLTFKEAV